MVKMSLILHRILCKLGEHDWKEIGRSHTRSDKLFKYDDMKCSRCGVGGTKVTNLENETAKIFYKTKWRLRRGVARWPLYMYLLVAVLQFVLFAESIWELMFFYGVPLFAAVGNTLAYLVFGIFLLVLIWIYWLEHRVYEGMWIAPKAYIYREPDSGEFWFTCECKRTVCFPDGWPVLWPYTCECKRVWGLADYEPKDLLDYRLEREFKECSKCGAKIGKMVPYCTACGESFSSTNTDSEPATGSGGDS